MKPNGSSSSAVCISALLTPIPCDGVGVSSTEVSHPLIMSTVVASNARTDKVFFRMNNLLYLPYNMYST